MPPAKARSHANLALETTLQRRGLAGSFFYIFKPYTALCSVNYRENLVGAFLGNESKHLMVKLQNVSIGIKQLSR